MSDRKDGEPATPKVASASRMYAAPEHIPLIWIALVVQAAILLVAGNRAGKENDAISTFWVLEALGVTTSVAMAIWAGWPNRPWRGIGILVLGVGTVAFALVYAVGVAVAHYL